MNLWKLACKVLIDGTGTLSKKHTAYPECYPTHLVSQQGVTVLGVNDKTYVDWIGALGANLTGYGESMSIPNSLEIKAALLTIKRFPVDKIKILKSGSAACAAAVRIARAVTGKAWVIGMGYHGWMEPFISAEKPGAGCVDKHYKKFESIDSILDYVAHYVSGIAACIVEPMMLDDSPQWKSRMCKLRRLCKEKGILFIADEIVTGGRWKNFSVSNDWKLKPDLMCLGKGLAQGHAIGIVGCTTEIAASAEKAGVFVSTTFSGATSGLVALIKHYVTFDSTDLTILWLRGLRLMRSFNRISKKVQLIGYPTRMTFAGDEEDIAKYWQEMSKLGHLCGKAFFPGVLHTDAIINDFLKKSKIVLKNLCKIKLQGRLPRPAFKRN